MVITIWLFGWRDNGDPILIILYIIFKIKLVGKNENILRIGFKPIKKDQSKIGQFFNRFK